MMTITPLMPVYPRCGFRPVRGEGAWLISEDGSRALDFASGIAVNLLGHGHPHLTKAIQEQAATLMHVSNLYGSPQGEVFAQRLVDTTFADTVFFTNSGAEAVDLAMTMARTYTGNLDLLALRTAYHGPTAAAQSITGIAGWRHPGMPGNVAFVPELWRHYRVPPRLYVWRCRSSPRGRRAIHCR
jgi:acetylornithine/N-succinyldiaminopimelate aminotransferase